MTPSQVADFFGESPELVWEFCRRGLMGIRTGKTYAIHANEMFEVDLWDAEKIKRLPVFNKPRATEADHHHRLSRANERVSSLWQGWYHCPGWFEMKF